MDAPSRRTTVGWIGAILALAHLAGCFRYGFVGSDDAGRDAAWDAAPGRDARLDRGTTEQAPDRADGPVADRAIHDLAPDGALLSSAPLANTGLDPLNTGASGTLRWLTCGATFSGEVVVKGLAAGQVYQLKLDQSWTVDYPTGRSLGSVGRTWDETVWQQGDTAGVLPSPYTGVGAGNVSAANVGDYLSAAEQDALYQAGHDLSGYLLFAFFTVVDAATATHTQDDTTTPVQVPVQADGFHFPIHADFSWHTSTSVQKGAVSLPAGPYKARFLVTREGSTYVDPLVLSNVAFTVGPYCP